MTLDRYIKAGIVSGIVLVGFTIAFGIIPSSMNNYQQFFVFPPDENSEKQKYLQSEEYQIFNKRFPDNNVDFAITKWDSQFSVSAMNKDTQNILTLSMSSNYNDNRIYKSAQCSALAMKSGMRYNADNVMVIPFLETTTCLDSVKP